MLEAIQYAKIMEALQQGSVQAMHRVANEIFNNAVAIMDTSFRVLAISKNPEVREDMLYSATNNEQYVSLETIALFREHDWINHVHRSPNQTILVNWGWFKDHPHMTTGIFHKGQVLGHITVHLPNGIIETWQDEALQTIANVLGIIMYKENVSKEHIAEEKEIIARELFAGTMEENKIHTFLEKGIIKKAKSYVVLCTNYIPSPNMHYIFPKECLYFIKQGYTLVLLQNDSTANESLFKHINNTGYQYGLSAPFINLNYTYRASIQAKEVLNFGILSNTQKNHWEFLDYAVDLILEKIKNMKNYIHPAIYMLKEYDQENNTSYLATLDCYLNNALDSSSVTKKLHIHRNSLYYRLVKIQEITQIDLHDTHTIIHLYISLHYVLKA